MSDTIAEDMTDKLGPLPVWVWGAIAAAVSIGGYYLYKRSHPTPPPSGAADASGAPDLSGGTSAAVNGLYATSGIPPQAQSISSSGDISTWITRAATAVAGAAGKSPSDVLAALQLWADGDTLTAIQKGYVDQAISLQGQPPSLPVAVSPVDPAAPSPAMLPKAASLYAPTYNGNYVKDAKTGLIAEVQSDGSLLGLTPDEWSTAAAKNGGKIDTIGHIGNAYSVASNLSRAGS